MKTKVSIILVCLTMMANSLYAQESLGDKYAWRLDSVVYALTPFDSPEDGGKVYPVSAVQYSYAQNEITKIQCFRAQHSDKTDTIGAAKYVYTLDVDSGLYSQDYYSSVGKLQFTQYPNQRKLVMKDSVRNVYNGEGRLIRQIRNYDFITLRLQTEYDEQTGMMSGFGWKPYSRIVRTEDEESAVEYVYSFSADRNQWDAHPATTVRSTYYNNLLTMEEKISDCTYHANGNLASCLVRVNSYNELGVAKFSVTREEQRNTNNMPVVIKATYPEEKETILHVQVDTFTYNGNNVLLSRVETERWIDNKSGLTLREKKYELADGDMQLKRDHRMQYDEANRMVLDVDSFVNSQGMWCYERKEYDAEGEEIYTVSSREDPAYGGWLTFSEEDHRPAEYYKLLLVSRGGWSVNGGPVHYDTLRETQWYYSNKFDMSRKREKLNTANFTWKLLNYNREQTTFNSDGTPASTIEYISNDPEGTVWEEKYLYTFTYDEEIGLYLRIKTAEMADNGDGTKSWQTLAQPLPDWYYKLGGGKAGMEREYYAEVQEDIEGHQAHLYYYNYVDSTATWELTYHRVSTYFPEPGCTKEASRYFWRKENSSMYVSGNRTEGLELFTDTFDISDEYGTLLERHAYYWADSSTLVCDTLILNEPTYDSEGRMVQNIEWTTDGTGNHPLAKYRYFYRADGSRYGCAAKAEYANGKYGAWSLTDAAGELVYDENGRIAEEIYYTLVDPRAEDPALVPAIRRMNHYEGEAEDWYLCEVFKWNTAQNEWIEAAPVYRGIAGAPLITFDETGNISDYEKGEEYYHLTYGTSLESEPVLSPAAFGVADEDFFLYSTWLHPETMKSRILSAYHHSDDKTALLSPSAHYMARFYYTQYREEVDTVKTELEEEITVEPEENKATFTWPAVSGGMSYTLIIWANEERTEKVCALQLAADGTLLEIDFSKSPRRAPAAYWATPVLNTTIENLLTGTKYWYTLEAYDEVGLLLETTYGTFTTAEGTEGLIDVQGDDVQRTKVLRNVQIYLIYEGRMYDIQGNQLK